MTAEVKYQTVHEALQQDAVGFLEFRKKEHKE